MGQLWTMVTYDLRQHLRTRAFFVWALGVPLALMLVFNALLSGAQDLQLDRVTVAVSTPAGDPAARELVGARLISHAGSLLSLAKHPASTVQILGAEKALFRALKTKHDTPKYGLIYHVRLSPFFPTTQTS